MTYTEIEYKYSADNVDLSEFHDFCVARSPDAAFNVSGFDYFYANKKDASSFCRHRVGPDANQLTFKRKLTDKNNYIRTEHNINLDPKLTLNQVKAFLSEFGFSPSGTIFKNCFIYKYLDYTFVFYVVYDKNLKELGRFLEIEMSEDKEWESQDQAVWALQVREGELKRFGIIPANRMRRSLYEMYGKE